MISVKNSYFKIDTENTTYLFKVNPLGFLEHIYYGKRISDQDDYSFLEERSGFGYGVTREKDGYLMFNEHASLETSSKGRGDNREVMVETEVDGDIVSEFLFEGYSVVRDFSIPGLPSANHKEETLALTLKDASKKLTLCLYYSTYPGTDVLTKSASLHNESKEKVTIRRLLSSQLDLDSDDFLLLSFDGAWAKERHIHTNPLGFGVTKIDSKCGYSSAYHNPFTVLKKKDTTLRSGDIYGFNLIYSGNHVTYFDRGNMHRVRVLTGINDDGFSWDLASNESFFTPEATLCYSSEGENGLTKNYHSFVRDHIVRGKWQYEDHPILLNDWEALHFDFDEEKLLSLAKKGKELGIELFVLDDGWFGRRDSDKGSLGDWFADCQKLPSGIRGLSDKIHEMGLLFGLWYEPEMVSPESELYRSHPEFVLRHPDYPTLLGRNQFVLDLSNPKVVDYLIDCIGKSFEEANLDYVKWDCNRVISDYLSSSCANQGETAHRYMLGLYRLLDALTKRFPDILFESCAAGGNRSDLGMLCYMPCFWCSDSTEPSERMLIQEGTLMCYPQSTIGAHVSASPNHQTLRLCQIEDCFNVACVGSFGYELDPTALSFVDTLSVRKQIEWYKKYRHLLSYGQYYELSSFRDSPNYQFVIVSKDEKEAVYFVGNGRFELNAPEVFAKPVGLNPSLTYRFEERRQNFDFVIEERRKFNDAKEEGDFILRSEKQTATLSGDALMNAGVRLYFEWGSGRGESRLMLDNGTRIYSISAKEDA